MLKIQQSILFKCDRYTAPNVARSLGGAGVVAALRQSAEESLSPTATAPVFTGRRNPLMDQHPT